MNVLPFQQQLKAVSWLTVFRDLWCNISLAGAAISIIFVATNVLSEQKYFVATNVFLSRQNFSLLPVPIKPIDFIGR